NDQPPRNPGRARPDAGPDVPWPPRGHHDAGGGVARRVFAFRHAGLQRPGRTALGRGRRLPAAVDPAVHPAGRNPDARRSHRQDVPVAGRLAQAPARGPAAHPHRRLGAVLGGPRFVVATAATISTVALPAFKNRGYDQRMVLGSIAAGASLGNLIPPGIPFIIYGSMTNTSASRLYMAGIVPGAIMTVLFLLTILAVCVWRPQMAGKGEGSVSWGDRLRHPGHLAGPLVGFGVVMGGIYPGWATVTESAALGVIVCLPIAAAYRKLNVKMLHECFRSTLRLTAMTALILIAALYLNFVLSMLGVPQSLSSLIKSLDVSPIVLLWVLAGMYLILG